MTSTHFHSSPAPIPLHRASAVLLASLAWVAPTNAGTFPLSGPQAVATYCPNVFPDPAYGGAIRPTESGFVVVSCDVAGTAPLDVNWPVPKFWNASGGTQAWTYANLGTVFALTLDEEFPPNIYVAASTVFGSFPHGSGVVGPSGPGAVYRIDGLTGNITTWLTLPNTGPALGDICYDRWHDQFFVSNFEDGKIYRVKDQGGVGSVEEVIDPFGADDGSPGFAPLGERVWALHVVNQRVLLFGLWVRDGGPGARRTTPWPTGVTGGLAPGNAVFAAGMNADGEILGIRSTPLAVMPTLPGQTYSNPVSDITSVHGGMVVITERTMRADIGTLGLAHEARVLQYDPIAGQFPNIQGGFAPTAENRWRVGRLGTGRNSAGGVAIDEDGRVWSTGDALHIGPDFIYGLQRIAAGGNEFDATPTLLAALVDLDDDTMSVPKAQPGDVEFAPSLGVSWSEPWVAWCTGDIYGDACPCANQGGLERGCGNSIHADGGRLVGGGLPSIASDTFLLHADGIPNSAALFFQGTSSANGGYGTPFGDGLLCVTGTVRRFRPTLAIGGTTAYPQAGDLPISVAGANAPGSLRYYQLWYRNSSAFCTAATFNLTNAIAVRWEP